MTRTIAQMATISGRNQSRLTAISSLIKQVDELHLIYNGGIFFENNEHAEMTEVINRYFV